MTKKSDSSKQVNLLLCSLLALTVMIGLGLLLLNYQNIDKTGSIESYTSCEAAGNPVTQSFPQQCIANGRVFTYPEK